MKKILCICFLAALMLSVSVPAFAINQSRTVIGADLDPNQVAMVYANFGLQRGDVIELTMTNAE